MNRILFVYQNAFSAIGGIQTFNKYFISSLEDIQKESNSIRCELLSVYDKSNDIKSTLPFSTANSNKLLAITKLITKTYSYDTFIFGHVNLAPLAVLIKVLNPKAKIIFCTHGIDVWHKLSKSTEWIMNKSTILAVSQFTANKLKEYNKNLNDIKIFPNCIKIGNYDENLKNNFNENKFNILSVTRLDKHEQYKGIHTVISALALLIENIPNIKYTIIGKGDDIERLKNLANKLNVSKYIDFLGFVDNIQSYYKYCDIFTLPSKNEGFGIVYLEAMQYKKPVIAVNYGGPTDVIINEESGYLCEFEDEKCLAEKINLLFKNKELSKELGENGYRRLMDNFTYTHFKNNLKNVLIEKNNDKIRNILFVHPLEGNAYEIYKAFDRNDEINIIPLLKDEIKFKSTLLEKIMYKFRLPIDRFNINKKLLSFDLKNINIIFVVKGNEIYPNTLKKVKTNFPDIKLINWSQDDMYAFHNRSLYYTFALKYYDLIVTQKSYNVDELKKLGAKKILFQNKAYSKDIHNPMKCDKKYNHDVVFIGFPEKERNTSIMYLAQNGIKIDIYGYPNQWKKINYHHDNITIHSESLYGKDYAEALSSAKISLCFLRKINRDLQTSRSIEIPACKGFMIAERTNEHLELFKENEEAVYFSNDYELVEKVKYYLSNEKKRLTIQENGYNRCIKEDYSYDNRIIEIIEKVKKYEN